MGEKKSLLLHQDIECVIDRLTHEQAGRIFKAILDYNRTKTVPELDDLLSLVFVPIQQSLDRDAERYEMICQKNRENIKSRWQKKEDTAVYGGKSGTTAYTHNNSNTNTNSHKDSSPLTPPKGKTKPEPPEKVKYAEFVSMTNDEYNKLLATYGSTDTAAMIEILDNYKGSNGKAYKSDYRAILSWVVKRFQQGKATEQHQQNKNNPDGFTQYRKEQKELDIYEV